MRSLIDILDLSIEELDDLIATARDIIARAMAHCAEDPLYVVAIGAITNVASALIMEPSIKENIDFYFEIFGLGRWLDRESVVFDDGTYEDKRQMYLEAARRLNTDIRDCLIIEDSPSAVSLARQLDPACIVALGHTAPAARLLELGADHYVRDFTEFDYAWLEH
mgnify:CR=1 FL=1